MSGLDPLAALQAGASAVSQAQIQAIDLGIAVEILQQQLSIGDLLSATVLPAQGGVDLLSIFGTTVAAQLPTGVNPGQSLLLQVTGFVDNQILVQNLGVVDPENPPSTVTVALPDVPEGAPTQAVVTTITPLATPPPAPASTPVTPSTPLAPPLPQGSIAPPSAVFVAASVQPSAASRAAAAAQEIAAEETPQLPASASATGSQAAVAVPDDAAGEVAQLGLEARIAATRAASIDIAELVRPSTPSPSPALPSSVSRSTGLPLPPGAAARTPVPSAPPLVTARAAPPTPAPVPVSARPLVAPSAEAALLERLRIPLSTITLAAARIAGTAGTALPRALARLETLLAGAASQDGRAASLRTLLNFAGRLDPSNARALPEQLAAFVNNFVGGPESKFAAMIRAFLESGTPADEAANAAPNTPANAPATASPNAPGARAPADPDPATAGGGLQAGAPPAAAAAAAAEPAVAARVAERAVALEYDAKAMVAAMIEAPGRAASPELTAALNDTLTAITALQVNVLNAQSLNPNTIAIPLPVFYREGGAPVSLHISRDAKNGSKLDADNFSIAFILDTKSLGTVAIDVQTVGRSVSVNVKTEGAPAASRFRSSLDALRTRLEQLRYNVAGMSAGVAPLRPGAAVTKPAAPSVETAPEKRTSSVLDMRA